MAIHKLQRPASQPLSQMCRSSCTQASLAVHPPRCSCLQLSCRSPMPSPNTLVRACCSQSSRTVNQSFFALHLRSNSAASGLCTRWAYSKSACRAGGSSLLPEASTLQVLDWLDWEETVLRPHLHFQDSAGLKQDVQHLQSNLKSSSYLVGDSLTLADIVVYASLLPFQVCFCSRLTIQQQKPWGQMS